MFLRALLTTMLFFNRVGTKVSQKVIMERESTASLLSPILFNLFIDNFPRLSRFFSPKILGPNTFYYTPMI